MATTEEPENPSLSRATSCGNTTGKHLQFLNNDLRAFAWDHQKVLNDYSLSEDYRSKGMYVFELVIMRVRCKRNNMYYFSEIVIRVNQSALLICDTLFYTIYSCVKLQAQ